MFIVGVAVLVRNSPEHLHYKANSTSSQTSCCYKVSCCVGWCHRKERQLLVGTPVQLWQALSFSATAWDQRQSLTSVVKRQLEDEADLSLQCARCPIPPHSSDPMQFLARRVSAKLEEGDYRGAVRVVSSEDTILQMRLTVKSIQVHTPSHAFHHHHNLRSSFLFQQYQKRKSLLPSAHFLEDQLEVQMVFTHNISSTPQVLLLSMVVRTYCKH